MKRVFADTHFFIALLSERDAAHEAAVALRHRAAANAQRPSVPSLF
jgi:predicted nucleic acid-binding protein